MKNTTALYAAITAFCLLYASPALSFGQESHGSILLNMAKSRMNYGDLNGTLKGYKKDINGLQAGLSYQAGISKHFSVVTEAYFLTKGGTVNKGNPVDDTASELKLRTIEMPVLARLHTGRFYFNAGPYLTYIMGGKESTGDEASHKISFGRNQYRRFETGVQTGAGYEFKIKKRQLAVDVRYTSGISSVSHSQELYCRTLNISVIVLKSITRKG